MKPMLAADYDESKLKFPLIAQPKVDGVRGLTIGGRLVGRSLKTHANVHTTRFYSRPMYDGLDGELAVGPINAPDLCRVTTGSLNRIEGEPQAVWYVFDDIRLEAREKPYRVRLQMLQTRAREWGTGVRVIPWREVNTLEELLAYDTLNLADGMEGTIVRDPLGLYKQGRSTVTKGELLRIKRFIEEEAVVIALEQGQINGNEAKTNELGRTERSSHQANMTPNGMVGTLICRDVKTGGEIRVAAGCMTHAERLHYWQQPSTIVGATIKYKCFPQGVKDKPRFPTFQTIRAASDIG